MAETRAHHRHELLSQLRSRILASAAEGRTRLPSERALAGELAVSRGALRSALTELAGEGLLQPKAQSGWHLSGRTISEPNNTVIGFTEMSRLFGHEPRSRVLKSGVRLARETEVACLRLSPVSQVWVIKRLRFLGSRPTSLEEVVMAADRAGDLTDLDMTDRSLFTELGRRGIEVSRTDVVVEAEVADESNATLLDLQPGSPLLTQHETSYDQHGRELFLCYAQYRADSYRFRSTLTRRTRR